MSRRIRRIGYEWHLRQLMATKGLFATTDLHPLLAERGVELSPAQVYRLVVQTPERLNLHTLMVLCEILECTPNDLIERVELSQSARLSKRAVGEGRVADIDPKPAHIRGARRPPRP